MRAHYAGMRAQDAEADRPRRLGPLPAAAGPGLRRAARRRGAGRGRARSRCGRRTCGATRWRRRSPALFHLHRARRAARCGVERVRPDRGGPGRPGRVPGRAGCRRAGAGRRRLRGRRRDEARSGDLRARPSRCSACRPTGSATWATRCATTCGEPRPPAWCPPPRPLRRPPGRAAPAHPQPARPPGPRRAVGAPAAVDPCTRSPRRWAGGVRTRSSTTAPRRRGTWRRPRPARPGRARRRARPSPAIAASRRRARPRPARPRRG